MGEDGAATGWSAVYSLRLPLCLLEGWFHILALIVDVQRLNDAVHGCLVCCEYIEMMLVVKREAWVRYIPP